MFMLYNIHRHLNLHTGKCFGESEMTSSCNKLNYISFEQNSAILTGLMSMRHMSNDNL